MKKIKKVWIENRVIFVLTIIVFICVCIMLFVILNYFFGPTKTNYGDRLEGIEQVQVTDEIKNNFVNVMKEDKTIEDVSIRTSGKIIYIDIVFKDNTTLVEARSKSLASLSHFEEKYLDFYDIHFTIRANSTENSEGFLLMGARNVNGSGLVWNNNTEIEKDSE